MLTTHDILWGIVFPAVIAIVVMLISHWPIGNRAAATQTWGPPLALAVGFIVTFAGIAARPVLKPVSVQGWLVHLCAAAFVVGIVATWRSARRWIVPAISIVLLALATWMLQPAHRRTVQFTAIVAAIMIVWFSAVE